MPVKQEEKVLLDLIARYQYLTDCKDNDLIDLGTYSKILWENLSEDDMERIKYYMEQLEKRHNDTSKFMDSYIDKE
jgi:hypothetical protein